MKRRGACLEFAAQREAELLKASSAIMSEYGTSGVDTFFYRLANMPSKRFWVSEERAAIVVAKMEAGRPLPKMRPAKMDMYQEIYKRYCELRKNYPDAALYRLVEMVVHQPANKFYIAPLTAMKYYYQSMRKRRPRKKEVCQ